MLSLTEFVFLLLMVYQTYPIKDWIYWSKLMYSVWQVKAQ